MVRELHWEKYFKHGDTFADLYTVTEMRINSDIWHWSIINQIFIGMSSKKLVINKSRKFGKILNWSPNEVCGKVFNEL